MANMRIWDDTVQCIEYVQHKAVARLSAEWWCCFFPNLYGYSFCWQTWVGYGFWMLRQKGSYCIVLLYLSVVSVTLLLTGLLSRGALSYSPPAGSTARHH